MVGQIIGYCVSGLMLIICCIVTILYQKKKQEDEERARKAYKEEQMKNRGAGGGHNVNSGGALEGRIPEPLALSVPKETIESPTKQKSPNPLQKPVPTGENMQQLGNGSHFDFNRKSLKEPMNSTTRLLSDQKALAKPTSYPPRLESEPLTSIPNAKVKDELAAGLHGKSSEISHNQIPAGGLKGNGSAVSFGTLNVTSGQTGSLNPLAKGTATFTRVRKTVGNIGGADQK